MPAENSNTQSVPARRADFPATHWTLVERLRGREADASQAMEALCRGYWYPIYATLRRGGHSQHDAEDLTQGFFADVLREGSLLGAEANRGRLRSFLLGMLKRFVADSARLRAAQKRGGGMQILSLEWERANTRYCEEPVDLADPETVYLSAWARSLVEGVRGRLKAGYSCREAEYAELEPFIESGEDVVPYRELGARLGLSESGARVAVYRLRQRFREMLTEAVRLTVSDPGEVADELAWLLAAAGRAR